MRLVVGAAIVRHGTVLAARRRYPDEVAGRWEFPGGKVDDGEPPEAALVREIDEELGLTIRVDRWLGAASVGTGIELRVALCTPDDPEAEPVAVEHDALRWLTPRRWTRWTGSNPIVRSSGSCASTSSTANICPATSGAPPGSGRPSGVRPGRGLQRCTPC